jgi:hypothetical protein
LTLFQIACRRALNAYPNWGYELQQEMALDQFLVGVKAADYIKQQLLMSSPKTLEEAIRKARQLEAAQLLMKQGMPSTIAEKSKPKAQNSIAVAAAASPLSDMSKVLELLQKMDSRITRVQGLTMQPRAPAGDVTNLAINPADVLLSSVTNATKRDICHDFAQRRWETRKGGRRGVDRLRTSSHRSLIKSGAPGTSPNLD